MIRFIKNKRGFTLLEVMMTVALIGIFFGIVYGFLNHSSRFLNQHNQEQDTYHQARIGMYRVVNKLKQYETLVYQDPQVVKGDGEDIDISELTQNLDGITEAKFELDGSMLKVIIKADPGLTLSTSIRMTRHYNP